MVLGPPRQKDFVPNMISGGATQAYATILVIDASVGAFEVGMGGNGEGQTKKHAQLIRCFGIAQQIMEITTTCKLEEIAQSDQPSLPFEPIIT